jgi:hypothetical protein
MISVQLVDRPAAAGDVPYTIEIVAREDETDAANNRQRRVIAVRDAKIRVLLVAGYPNYEFRYLKSLLERDATFELATYLQDADPDFAEQDKTALRSMPVGRDELLGYDVLLLADVDPRLAPPAVWQHVRAFVAEKGGGVAFVAGPRYLPWLYQGNTDVQALLPADLVGQEQPVDGRLPAELAQGFTVRPTALGMQSPPLQLGDSASESASIWNGLAPQYWLAPLGKLKPAAQVLATAAQIPARTLANADVAITEPRPLSPSAAPVITFQFVGAGRVLLHAVDSTWL